jgi:hypothetical protein
MNEIGHNQPPSMVGVAVETTAAVSAFLSETPVVENEEQAREAKVFLDRGNLCVQDLEAERDGLVRPLNERVKQINGRYRGPRELLEKVVNVLRSRLDQYLRVQEQERKVDAEYAQAWAENAEYDARVSERIEQDAMECAQAGELGMDIAAVTLAADQAFANYQKAERQAALAEKETRVKIGGGFRRALGLRSVETLCIVNWREAMEDLAGIGALNAEINAGILKGARLYRKLKGKLPAGIEATIERKT